MSLAKFNASQGRDSAGEPAGKELKSASKNGGLATKRWRNRDNPVSCDFLAIFMAI